MTVTPEIAADFATGLSEVNAQDETVEYVGYTDESMLPSIKELVSKDLSEPYSVFTYRYFLQKWPHLCVCVFERNSGQRGDMVGTILCKEELEEGTQAGYIAMLTVGDSHRRRGIGEKLAMVGIARMIKCGCKEIVLETELSNLGALKLYQKMGFVRDEKMARYYLNGGDAYRLKLFVKKTPEELEAEEAAAIAAAKPSLGAVKAAISDEADAQATAPSPTETETRE
jgi:peptide alpha-N-acetyltransferase